MNKAILVQIFFILIIAIPIFALEINITPNAVFPGENPGTGGGNERPSVYRPWGIP